MINKLLTIVLHEQDISKVKDFIKELDVLNYSKNLILILTKVNCKIITKNIKIKYYPEYSNKEIKSVIKTKYLLVLNKPYHFFNDNFLIKAIFEMSKSKSHMSYINVKNKNVIVNLFYTVIEIFVKNKSELPYIIDINSKEKDSFNHFLNIKLFH